MWSSLFDLFLIFHEASAKKVRKKSSMAFQCQDWDTKFSYQIDYFWLFMKLQQKTWRNIYLHFNAKTVIQHFLLTLILFLTFHEESVKNLEEICTGCTARSFLCHFNAEISNILLIAWILLCTNGPQNGSFRSKGHFIGIAGFWNGIPSLFQYRPALEYGPVTDFYRIPAEG